MVHSLSLPIFTASAVIHATSCTRSVARSLTPDCSRPLLHHSATWLLLLTLCWPASWGAWIGSAARLSGCIPKFGHVSSYMLDVFHWLPSRRTSYQCGIASLLDLAFRTSDALPWMLCVNRSLCSTEQAVLIHPFDHSATKQNCTFSVVGLCFGVGHLWHSPILQGLLWLLLCSP